MMISSGSLDILQQIAQMLMSNGRKMRLKKPSNMAQLFEIHLFQLQLSFPLNHRRKSSFTPLILPPNVNKNGGGWNNKILEIKLIEH